MTALNAPLNPVAAATAAQATPPNRWKVVGGALLVQIILGTVYAFSVFVRPLENEFGWGRTTTQWAFSFALASFALSMIPAGRLQDRIGPRRVASIGGALLGLSFVLGALPTASTFGCARRTAASTRC